MRDKMESMNNYLHSIDKKIIYGCYSNDVDELQKLKKQNDKDILLNLVLFRAYIYSDTVENALNLIDEFELSELKSNTLIEMRYLIDYITLLLNLGRYEEIYDLFLEIKKLIGETQDTQYKILDFNILKIEFEFLEAKLHYKLGELNKSVARLNKLANRILYPDYLAQIYLELSRVEWSRGNLVFAQNHLRKVTEVSEPAPNEIIKSELEHIEGLISYQKGNLKNALNILQKNLIKRKELNYNFELEILFEDIALIYHRMGDYENAIVNYNNCLQFLKRKKNNYKLSIILLALINIHNEKEDIVGAKSLFKTLSYMIIDDEGRYLDQIVRIGKSLIIKSSSKLELKGEAIKLLKNILSSKIEDFQLFSMVTFNLCDLLFDEWRFFGREDSISEIKEYLTRIYIIASENSIIHVLAEIFYILAKISIIENDDDNAISLLNHADNLITKQGFDTLSTKIVHLIGILENKKQQMMDITPEHRNFNFIHKELYTSFNNQNFQPFFQTTPLFKKFDGYLEKSTLSTKLLMKTESNLENIFNSIGNIIMIVDKFGNYEGFIAKNDSPNNVEHHNDLFLSNHIHQHLINIERYFAKVFEKQKILDIEYQVQFANNIEWYATQLLPIFDESRKVIGITIIVKSITKYIEDQQQLSNLNTKLLRSNENLKEFADIISHDFKSPITQIVNYGEILSKKIDDKINQEENEILQQIITGTFRLNEKINVLINYSELNVNNENNSEISLNNLINQLIHLELKPQIMKTKAIINISENLPHIIGVYPLVSQLFQNIINNALKFVLPNTTPIIDIYSKQLNDRIIINIRDNGIGISQENIEKIFYLFTRIHHPNKYPGRGIGLATCKKIIKLHNWDIKILSTINEGSVFSIIIPRG